MMLGHDFVYIRCSRRGARGRKRRQIPEFRIRCARRGRTATEASRDNARWPIRVDDGIWGRLDFSGRRGSASARKNVSRAGRAS